MTRPLSVAVLVKQVPLAEEFRLGADGRLVRDGVPPEFAAAGGRRCLQRRAAHADAEPAAGDQHRAPG